MSQTVTQLRVALMQQLGEVEAAAREWGVRPDHPEGRFVAALMAAQKGHADMVLAAADVFDMVSSEVGTWLNTARDTADANARRAEAQTAGVAIKSEQAIATVVDKLVPAATAALAGAVVIRERRRTMGFNLSWLGGGAVLALVLVASGYAVKAAADRPAVTFHERCLRAAVKAESSGKLYCPVEALSDHAAGAQSQQQRR